MVTIGGRQAGLAALEDGRAFDVVLASDVLCAPPTCSVRHNPRPLPPWVETSDCCVADDPEAAALLLLTLTAVLRPGAVAVVGWEHRVLWMELAADFLQAAADGGLLVEWVCRELPFSSSLLAVMPPPSRSISAAPMGSIGARLGRPERASSDEPRMVRRDEDRDSAEGSDEVPLKCDGGAAALALEDARPLF